MGEGTVKSKVHKLLQIQIYVQLEKLNKQLMNIDKSLLIMPDNPADYANVPKL